MTIVLHRSRPVRDRVNRLNRFPGKTSLSIRVHPWVRIHAAGLLLGCFCYAVAQAVSDTAPPMKQTLYKAGKDGYHTYRIPAIVKSTKGTLLAFCEGRESQSDHGNVDIVLRRSKDDGKTWSDMTVVRNNGTFQAGNPCPIIDESTGQVMLFFCESKVSERSVLQGKGTREVCMMVSDDDGLTWSEPRNISSMTKKADWRWYAVGPCSGIQIQSGKYKGRLVVPANHSIHFEDGKKWEYRCHALYSDDHGTTWTIGSSSKAGASETQIAEVAPDRLIQDIRMQTHRKGLRAVRFSDDGGATWTPFKHDPTRTDPVCQGSVIAVPQTGSVTNRLYSSNPAGKSKRVNMTVYTSSDGGKDWQKFATLNNTAAAYSNLIQMNDNQIACFYESGERNPYESIVFQLIDLPERNAVQLSELTRGVKDLGMNGIAGPLAIWGTAFPIISGPESGVEAPIIAGAEYGQGRVVAFGHGGLLLYEGKDNPRFRKNVFQWCAGSAENLKIGIIGHRKDLSRLFKQEGYQAQPASMDTLDSFSVITGRIDQLNNSDLKKLQTYVHNGGGLVLDGLGWGWLQLHPGKTLANDHLGNRLFRSMGISWADGYAGNAFTVKAIAPETNCSKALDYLGSNQAGKRSTIAAKSIIRAIRALPTSDIDFMARLNKLSEGQLEQSALQFPITGQLEQVLLTAQIEKEKLAAVSDIRPHPAASVFPGNVLEPATRLKKQISINTAIPGWHSTGLYAAPGEIITAILPEKATTAKLKLQIGAHKDLTHHHRKWKRAPDIVRRFDLAQQKNQAASAFGGLVYIDVPPNAKIGTVTIIIDQVVKAPTYVQGVTSKQEWLDSIRHYPAPWGEIVSDRLILTVPSSELATLNTPEKLINTWNRVLDLDAELASRPKKRLRPERIVIDRQISVGYMHAGYPIMAQLDQAKNSVNYEHLLSGNWGFFHELGHNHQNPDWTFDGTVEVTVNLFSLYVYEHLCGINTEAYNRSNAAWRKKTMAKYMNKKNGDWARWKKEPFEALVMYVQLKDGFGWETYQEVFASYHKLPAAQRPRTDQQKMDRWLIEFSKAAKVNLAPFLSRWGMPLTQSAKAKVAHLPVWYPEEMKPFLEPNA